MMTDSQKQVSLNDTKTKVSSSVEETANNIVNGKRVPAGELKVTYLADDFDAPSPEIERLFGLRD